MTGSTGGACLGMLGLVAGRFGLFLLGVVCGLSACSQRAVSPQPPVEISLSGHELRQSFKRVDGHLISPPLFSSSPVTTVGVMVDVVPGVAGQSVHLEVRTLQNRGEWQRAMLTWAEGHLSVYRADLDRTTRAVELRVPTSDADRIAFVVWSASAPATVAPSESPIDTARAALSAELVSAGVRPRDAWGARPGRCTIEDLAKNQMTVHHTVTPPTSSDGFEARIRQLQAFHMDTRGWCDIGYHFLVTVDGALWEARDVRYIGAHVRNHNEGNLGVSFVGCFHPTDSTCAQPEFQPAIPPESMIEAGGRLLGALAHAYEIPVEESSIRGHREHQSAQTACPGDALAARLPDLRSAALPPEPSTGRIRGVVWNQARTSGPSDPGNVRISHAVVTTSSGERQEVRAADGFWSFELPPGLVTLTASAAGFIPSSRELTVVEGEDVWGSIGLLPEPTSFALIVTVLDAERDMPIPFAEVQVDGFGASMTDRQGQAGFDVSPGTAQVKASASGYRPSAREVNFQGPGPERMTLRLERIPIPEGVPILPTGDDPLPSTGTQSMDSGGCVCASGPGRPGPAMMFWAGLMLVFCRRFNRSVVMRG